MKRLYTESYVSDIAEAIREKNGTDTAYTIAQMGDAIRGIAAQEVIAHADIPEYVKTEALEVANKVQEVRQSDSIVFLAMSDTHHYGQQAGKDSYTDADGVQTTTSNTHAAMAAKTLAYALNFDFMAHLGDISWGHKLTTPELLETQIEDLSDLLNEANTGIPCFRAIGNHDTGIYYHNAQIEAGETGVFTETGDYLYQNFTAYSESDDTVVSGEENGGYCYRDFTDKKLRVFLLNTSETLVTNQTDSPCMTAVQRLWFANALLDLNAKSDAAKWGFIVLCHYPADYGGCMPLSEILKAYVEGGSISVDGSTVSFDGNNSAKMIAQFHGHVHNFLVSNLYSYATGSGVAYEAKRVAIPNGQYNRENYYSTVGSYTDHTYAEETSYPKTANTANDTSFVVNVVNPSEQIIYSFCYGAGRDRVISYSATEYHSVTYDLRNVAAQSSALAVEDGAEYVNTLTAADGYEIASVTVTMGGEDVTDSVYSDGVISISSVTGDIVITAVAVKVLNVTNQIPISIDTDGSVYNGVGYQQGYRLNSSGEATASSAMYLTGFIPLMKGDTVRFANITLNKANTNNRVGFYDSSFAALEVIAASNFANSGVQVSLGAPEFDDSGNLAKFTLVSGTNTMDAASCAYIRVSATSITEDSIITVNEEIQ